MLSIQFVKLGEHSRTIQLHDGSTIRDMLTGLDIREEDYPKIYINGKPQRVNRILHDGEMLISVPRLPVSVKESSTTTANRWKKMSLRIQQAPPLHGLSEYLQQCSQEVREDFAFDKHEQE